MATWNSAMYSGQLGGAGASLNAGSGFPLAKNAYGKLRIVQVPYTVNGNEATNELINLCILKPGARVLASRSWLTAENCGTTLTLAVGDASDSGRYANGLTLSNTTFNASFGQAGTDAYVPTDIAGTTAAQTIGDAANQTVVKAKVLSQGSLTAGKNLLFTLAVVDE